MTTHRHHTSERIPSLAAPLGQPGELGEPAAHRDLRALQALASLLRQKWAAAVLLLLADTGPHSYTSLVRQVNAMPVDGNLTPKTATATTRALQDQGLISITRSTEGTRFHTSSTYALTDYGRELVAELRENLAFLHREHPDIPLLPRQRRPT